jgi:hypothetical protein
MEALQTVLFENPLGIYIALAVFGALGLVSYQNLRTIRSARPTTFALVAAAAVFAISTLVVTDREAILAKSDDIAIAINTGDLIALEFSLADDFAGPDKYPTRKKAISWLAKNIEKYEITSVKFKVLDLEVRDDLATMSLQTDVSSELVSPMRLNWLVVWAKRSAGWVVSNASGPLSETNTADDSDR